MRKTLCALALIVAIGAGGTGTAMADGNPQRPSGELVQVAPSDNGGDNGWDNCGHNSSGGNPPVHGGNGGYTMADCQYAPTDGPV